MKDAVAGGNTPTADAVRQHLDAGRLVEAEALVRTGLADIPHDPTLWHLAGRIALRRRDVEGARAALAEALARGADEAEVCYDLGQASLALGDTDAAIGWFERALRCRPAYLRCLVALGNAHLHAERWDDAERRYDEALALRPDLGEAHNNKALALLRARRPAEAVAALQAGLRAAPDTPALHENLLRAVLRPGVAERALVFYDELGARHPDSVQVAMGRAQVLRALGRLDEAIAACRRATLLAPDAAAAHGLCGEMLIAADRPDEAEPYLRRATALAPDDASHRARLAETLARTGRVTEGLQEGREAVALAPESAEIRLTLARLLVYDERPAEVVAELDRAEALAAGDPSLVGQIARLRAVTGGGGPRPADDPQSLLARADTARDPATRREVLDRIEAVLRLPPSRPSRRDLHFAAARLADKLQEWERAFRHAAEGNRLRDDVYEVDEVDRFLERVRTIYSPERWLTMPRSTCESRRPIFVVGLPRSGTSLVEQILARHPQVGAAGELLWFNDAEALLRARSGLRLYLPELAPWLSTEVLDETASAYLAHLDERVPGAPRVTDKMPHNFVRLGLIAQVFPHARFVLCARDPRDTLLSIWFHQFAGIHRYAYDLGHLAHHYRFHRALMDHWRALDLPIHEVRYERLVESPREVIGSLLAALDLPWDDRCLTFHESERVVLTASHDQVRQPLYRGSVGRWRHYAPYLGPILELE